MPNPKHPKKRKALASLFHSVVPFWFKPKHKHVEYPGMLRGKRAKLAAEYRKHPPEHLITHHPHKPHHVGAVAGAPVASIATQGAPDTAAPVDAKDDEQSKLQEALTDEEIAQLEEEAKHPQPEAPAGALDEITPEEMNALKPKEAPVDHTADITAQAEAATLEEEDGWMKKAARKDVTTARPKGTSVWQLLRRRFSWGRAATADAGLPVAPPVAAPASIDPKELRNDAFLGKILKVPQKEEKAVPQMPTAEPSDAPVTPLGQKREKGAPEEIPTLKSFVDIKVPAPVNETATGSSNQKTTVQEPESALPKLNATAPTPSPAVPVARPKKHIPFEQKTPFQAFLGSLSNIGLGKEKTMFVQNIATMLTAGLPLIDALRTLQVEARAKPMKKLIGRILEMVESGSPLWRAMDEQNLFSLHALALVRIGEEAGNLAENMAYLAEQEEKDHSLKSKVQMAMIYPTIVLVIMFVIVMGLGLFVLPNLIGVLYSLNVPLPFVTKMVIGFTEGLTTYGYVIIPGIIGSFVLILILAKFTRFKYVTQWIMFRVPGIGLLARQATIARFGVILGGLLRAGVPVIEALQSLVQVTPILAYRRMYEKILAHVTVGDSFSKSFAAIHGSQRLIPPSVQQLVITGEKSGSLAEIMLKVADIYEKKASETAQKLPIILEPMLLLFIGSLVGTIAFSIIVPIYSIVGNVGH